MSEARHSWFWNRRMEWIEETLKIFGFINRHHIEKKFGVSTPQASTDLKDFQRIHPTWIKYDQSAKRFVVAGDLALPDHSANTFV